MNDAGLARNGKGVPARTGWVNWLGGSICGCIAADLTFILDDNVAAKGRYVPVNLSANADTAAEAGDIGDLFSGSDADVMPKLGAVSGSVCKSCGGGASAKKQA